MPRPARYSAVIRAPSGSPSGSVAGLKLDRPAPGGEPRYVLSIQPVDNRVVVGRGELLDVDEVVGDRAVWTSARPDASFGCAVQLRAHGMVSPAQVSFDGERVVARLDHPQRGVAAGQALVMYDGDTVLGSATITSARRATVTA